MRQAHIFISGFVQGVGFRAYVVREARNFGLKGWVCNTLDGRVEAILQGEEGKIKKMIEFVNHGPFLAEVEEVVVEWEEAKEIFQGFEARH